MRAGTSAAVKLWPEETGARVTRDRQSRQIIRRLVVRRRPRRVVIAFSKSEGKKNVVEVGDVEGLEELCGYAATPDGLARGRP
jgi:hypothetical protein